jgi:hypothetical protein
VGLVLPTVIVMTPRRHRAASAALAAALVASTLGVGAAGSSAVEPSPGHPTNAASIFKWGVPAWHDEFKSQVAPLGWDVSATGHVENRNGMLTLMAGPKDGVVTATSQDQAATEGRWEARVRLRNYRGPGTATYSLFWELVPADGVESCGANGIVLATYKVDDAKALGAVRTLPNAEFTFKRRLNLARDEFHTFAVEVTADHIAWFVDTKVVRYESRPEALSGVSLKPRFRLQGEVGQTMKPAWMQMDWARYYTMARPNRKPIDARPMRQGTYADAC